MEFRSKIGSPTLKRSLDAEDEKKKKQKAENSPDVSREQEQGSPAASPGPLFSLSNIPVGADQESLSLLANYGSDSDTEEQVVSPPPTTLPQQGPVQPPIGLSPSLTPAPIRTGPSPSPNLPAPARGRDNAFFRGLLNQTRSPIDQLSTQLSQMHGSGNTVDASISAIKNAAMAAQTKQDLLAIIQLVGGSSSHGRGFRGLQARLDEAERFMERESGHAYIENQTYLLYVYLIRLYKERFQEDVPGSEDLISAAKKKDFDKPPPKGGSKGRGGATIAPRGRLIFK